MTVQLETGTGAHPSNREFVEQLIAWGFVQRRTDGVHLVFRAPHGGTLRVVRSLLGRSDTAVVAKAARFLSVDVAQFWAGPHAADVPTTPARAAAPAEAVDGRTPASRDRIISLVLAAHTAADRPLGFDQVVQMCNGEITRDQVRGASSTLCRDGDLDRIRSGIYQWSQGRRAQSGRVAPVPQAAPVPQVASEPPAPAQPKPVGHPERFTSAELFDQLFPRGVRMTAEVLADYERWTELTEKLAAYAAAS